MKNVTKQEYEKKNPWGMLTSVDLYHCDPKIMRSAKEIKRYARELCRLIDMKRFGPTQCVNFGENPRVSGYSMTQLIETSLISGHFANQSNAIYLDIFSCKYYDPQKAAEFSKDFFKAKKFNFTVTLRK
ncbi:S-adenosylmethionine decarboxylase [Patescibacteria group bacterium]|nr:S-adenosylmethionine decarboxylase [Patescibacteria group bacterium]